MCDDALLEPIAVQEVYVDDAEFGVRDGNVFITFIRETNGGRIVPIRIIAPVARFVAMREKVRIAMGADEPPTSKVIKLVG